MEKFRPLVHSPILSWKFSVRSCLKENVHFYTKIANVKGHQSKHLKGQLGPRVFDVDFFQTKGGQLRFRVNDVTFLACTLAEDNIIEAAADAALFGYQTWLNMS